MTPSTIEPDTLPAVMNAVLKLTPDARFRVAMEALTSLEPTPEVLDAERAALKAELTRRWERMRSGEDRGYTLEEVMAALHEQAERRKTT